MCQERKGRRGLLTNPRRQRATLCCALGTRSRACLREELQRGYPRGVERPLACGDVMTVNATRAGGVYRQRLLYIAWCKLQQAKQRNPELCSRVSNRARNACTCNKECGSESCTFAWKPVAGRSEMIAQFATTLVMSPDAGCIVGRARRFRRTRDLCIHTLRGSLEGTAF